MLVVIVAPGSRGDVEPYIALGQGLLKAGYTVGVVAHEDFRDLAASHGLGFTPIPGRAQDYATSADMSRLLERGNLLRVLAQMGVYAREGAVSLTKAGMAACREADLLVAGPGGLFVALALAERFDLPLVQAHYIPLTPTSTVPSFVCAGLPCPRIGTVNRLSYHLARQMLWQPFRSADNLARSQVLGLSRASLRGPFASPRLTDGTVLYGYSTHVIPRPRDWSEEIEVTGYWPLEPNDDWSPPRELEAFLAAGAPPVFIGFGSMPSRDPAQAMELLLSAVALSSRRAVILQGWGGLRADNLPRSVYPLSGAPFGWLFPRMAAVVHHGGAGTTAAGLRAGVPSIVVPFFGDQPYWGRRVADLGVGPEPIPRKRLTPDRLAAAIRQACESEDMRERAARLGQRLRAEDGVARAVEVITRRYPPRVDPAPG